MNLFETLAEDLRVLSPDKSVSLLRALLSKRHFRPIFTYRLARAARTRSGPVWLPVRFLTWWMHRRACAAMCMELPLTCRIGPGLRIFHGYGLVVHGGVTIGSGVTLKHHTTIGATNRGVPTVGDNVEIGVHSVILGPVHIGDQVTIGAGSLITRDVPHGATVVTASTALRSIRSKNSQASQDGA